MQKTHIYWAPSCPLASKGVYNVHISEEQWVTAERAVAALKNVQKIGQGGDALVHHWRDLRLEVLEKDGKRLEPGNCTRLVHSTPIYDGKSGFLEIGESATVVAPFLFPKMDFYQRTYVMSTRSYTLDDVVVVFEHLLETGDEYYQIRIVKSDNLGAMKRLMSAISSS
jgi:hypothetical protein